MTTDSQENRHRVYIDATIPSYLVSKPSRVPQTAEWQKITRDFWRDNRFEFILSDLVIAEISIGDRNQVAEFGNMELCTPCQSTYQTEN